MNFKQKIIMAVGIITFLVISIFPPYQSREPYRRPLVDNDNESIKNIMESLGTTGMSQKQAWDLYFEIADDIRSLQVDRGLIFYPSYLKSKSTNIELMFFQLFVHWLVLLIIFTSLILLFRKTKP